MNLSVVIPAHNEEEGVRPTVERLYSILMEAAIPFEILVVNDHSIDQTEQVLHELSVELPGVRYINNQKQKGFGYAIQAGLENFTGDAVCIVMADASDDPRDVVAYYRELEKGYECVFGSRFTRQSKVVDYPRHKLYINRLANWFINILFQLHFNDTTNAFKAYRREVIQGVMPILSSHFNITVELPLKAITRGYSFTTIPINWYNRSTGVSKLKIKEMGSRYLFIVLYVWLEHLLSRGDYRRSATYLSASHQTMPVAVTHTALYEQGARASMSLLSAAGVAQERHVHLDASGWQSSAEVATLPVGPVALSSRPSVSVSQADVQGRKDSNVGVAYGEGFTGSETPGQSTSNVSQATDKVQRDLLTTWQKLMRLTLLTVLACVAIVARRPDALLHPQFWAEDGMIWYAQAYNYGGWAALLTPQVGYLQTVSRLVAWLAMLFPLAFAPLIFNVAAIIIQALPVPLLMSGRFDRLIPDSRLRWLLVVLYLALPFSAEVDATITNAQWHLALLTLMIILAVPFPRWRIFDGMAIVIGGLTGPFCIPLLPVALARCIQTRARWLYVLTGLNLLTVCIQVLVLLHSPRARAPLGATPMLGTRIVASHIYLGLLVGEHAMQRILISSWWHHDAVPIVITVVCSLAIIYTLLRAPIEVRLFVLYGVLLGTLSMISPLVSRNQPQWPIIEGSAHVQRYFILPMLAFGVSLVWMLTQRRIVRNIAFALLFLIAVTAVPYDWSYSPFADMHWQQQVQRFNAAPAGSEIDIPINPSGWTMHLYKR